MARLARYAWAVLIYNLAVIAWGAYVRATGSGAGCGAHWPLCNGEVLVRPKTLEMLVEFSHRATSGLALISVVVLFFWARRISSASHPVRLGATLSLAFMLSEAALGAGLVLFQLVAQDASAARAFAVGAHLLNTFLLLAAMTLTVHWASDGAPVRFAGRREAFRFSVGAAALLVVSMAGAVTALGDTLFPSATLAEGLSADLSATSHFLIRLRTIHPILAVMVSIYLASVVWQMGRGSARGQSLARTMVWLIGAQLAVGLMNVLMLAPVWLQLLHLLLADGVWIAYVFLGADVLADTAPDRAVPHAVPQRA